MCCATINLIEIRRELALRRKQEQNDRIVDEKQVKTVSPIAIDNNRTRPLVWCNQEMTFTLASSFTIAEPKCDVERFYKWASTTSCARPQFLVCSFEASNHMALSAEAMRLLDTPNAGGNSALSEAVSFDTLRAQYGCQLVRTEMEIDYWCVTKITDYSVMAMDARIGVSVTRACKFRGRFTMADATQLLTKKLYGVNESTKHVITPHSWNKQILHIWCQRAAIADILACAYARLDASLRSDTLVLCTIAQNDEFLFFGRQDVLSC